MVTSMLRMLGPEMYVQWLSLPRAPRKQRQFDYAKTTSRALSGESYSDTVSCYVLSLMLLLTINCSNFICLSKTDSWSRSSTYQKLNIDLLELESRCSHGSRMPFLLLLFFQHLEMTYFWLVASSVHSGNTTSLCIVRAFLYMKTLSFEGYKMIHLGLHK